MRITGASIEPFRIGLRQPLQTAQGPIAWRAGVLFQIACEGGIAGVGEASPLPGFGGESLADARAALEAIAAALPGMAAEALDDVSMDLTEAVPAARAAFETARLDALARRDGVSLAARLRGGPVSPSVPVNALLRAVSPAEIAREAAQAVANGYGTLKIKLGVLSLDEDLARLRALRAAVPPEVRVRADANGAWSEREARSALDPLERFDLEYVEQPVAAEELDALARLRRASPVPIAADESIRSEADAQRVIDVGAADVLVLKPAWLGGPVVSLRIAARARAAALRVVITSALDAAVGRAAALHTAAALGGGFAAGLATGAMLRHDVASLPDPKDGRSWLPEGPGLGLTP